MSMRAYAIRIVLGCIVLVCGAVYGITHAAESKPPIKPSSYTLVIVTETYHGTSSVTIPLYASKAACTKAERVVHAASVDMQDEKETDFLYTDTYCVPLFGVPHAD